MLPIVVIIFFITPLGSLLCSLLGMICSKKDSKKYLLFFALAMAIISFHLEPRITDDGTRVLALIEFYSYMDFSQLLEVDRFYREPITHIIYFLVGKTGSPKLIFSIGAFLQYYAILYVVLDYADKINARVTVRIQAILLVLACHSYFPAVGSFRFFTASAICFLSWYLLSLKDKKIPAIFLCFLACMIHSGIYMQFIIMIITLLTWLYSTKTKWVKVGLIIWSLAYGLILTFLERFSSFYLFEVSGEKLERYSHLDTYDYVQVITIISGLAMCILFIYMAYKKSNDELVLIERENIQKYYDLFGNYMFFCLGSIFIGHYIFRRLTHMAFLASAIPILMYGLQKQRNTVSLVISNLVIFLATLTGFLYSFRVVAAGFDIPNGELFIFNIFIFIYELFFM